MAFAVIAGYADAVGYLRFKAFAGMMTGNTVLMGLATFGHAELPVWGYAVLLGLFFVAAAASYRALPYLAPAWLLGLEAALIILADLITDDRGIVPLVLAMGIQNPVATRMGVPLNTTFITGNILRFAEGLARWLHHPSAHLSQPFGIFGLVWLGYAVGAALGTGAYRLTAWPSVIPVALLVFIFAWGHRRAASP